MRKAVESMTLKEIKEEIKRLENSRKMLFVYPKEIVELKQKLYLMQNEHREKALEKAKPIDEDIKHLEMHLRDKKQSAKAMSAPIEVQNWLNNSYGIGVDFGYGRKDISWLSPDKEWAIVSIGGTMFWSGIGYQSYGRANHRGVRVGTSYHSITGIHRNGKFVSTQEYEGRLTKEVREKIIAEINEKKADKSVEYSWKNRWKP